MPDVAHAALRDRRDMKADPISGNSRHALILGCYSRLPIEALEPFARTLKATDFHGRFHIIAAGYDRDGLDRLAELADHVRPVDDDYSVTRPPMSAVLGHVKHQRGARRFYAPLFQAVVRCAPERNSLDRWRNLEYYLEGLQSLRYGHYYRAIIEDAPDAAIVMISDLRDVVFQRDPFAEPVDGLELYLESSSETIGEKGWTTEWLLDLYGDRFVDARRGHVVSCSGTVIGTRAAMLAYLSEMQAAIIWRRRPMGHHDQGVHNWLIQSKRVPYATLVRNEYGRVITLGTMGSPRIEEGVVLNADGSVPAVVHQWDRHPELVPLFGKSRG